MVVIAFHALTLVNLYNRGTMLYEISSFHLGVLKGYHFSEPKYRGGAYFDD